jgi:hypothetical protein
MGLGCLVLVNRMVATRSEEWAKWVLFFAMGGFAGNFVLSLTDHAVNGFFHRSEWIPVVSSALATGSFLVYFLGNPGRSYAKRCVVILVLQDLVGSAGFLLHIRADLHGPSQRLLSNIISGAPPFAPLLLRNLAILGSLGLVGSKKHQQAEDAG